MNDDQEVDWVSWMVLAGVMIAITLAVFFFVTACAPTFDVRPYQDATEKRCGFRPSQATVSKILAVGNEVLSTPETMSMAICHAVVHLGSEGD